MPRMKLEAAKIAIEIFGTQSWPPELAHQIRAVGLISRSLPRASS